MNKTYNILFLIFLSTLSYAQVGVGTTSPQKELHIAGTTSTIRIEKLNSVNNSLENDGINLAPVFVDGKGDLVLGDGSGNSGISPINFLIEDTNFIPNDPYNIGENTGKVVNNNDLGETLVEEKIRTIAFTVPQEALIEVKFGITIMIKGSDLKAGPPFADVTYDQSITIGVFFCIDIDNNGLDSSERNLMYGQYGQYHETQYGGITGYSYMNSQGYLTLPAGTHRVYFFGVVADDPLSYTSVGYGGQMDYLKIRVYN